MDGFKPTPEIIARLRPLYFHFWTLGQPQIIQWGRPELTRIAHGTNTGVF